MNRLLTRLLLTILTAIFLYTSCISCSTYYRKTIYISGSRSPNPKLYPSVVLIKTKEGYKPSNQGGSATAWAFDKDHLMTAGHFCEDVNDGILTNKISKNLSVWHADVRGIATEIGEATINSWIFNYKHKDICVLDMEDHGLEPLIISENIDIAETEDPVTMVGAPTGRYPIRRDGYIWAITEEFLSIAIETQPGSSGSPVMWNGEIIGMIVRTPNRLNISGLAVRADDLLTFLEEHGIK